MRFLLVSIYLSFFLVNVSPVLAGDQLPIMYDEEDLEVVESQQSYIDNQAYLREFERQRRERVLAEPSAPASVLVIKKQRYRYLPYDILGKRRYHSDGYREPFGLEFSNGSTTIRYFDGYQPNCCGPRTYIYHPHRPRPEPYLSDEADVQVVE